MPSRSTLLDDRAIARALTRMASELVERCHGTSDLVLVGIQRRGVDLAQRLARMIEGLVGRAIPTGKLTSPSRDDLRPSAPARIGEPTAGGSRWPDGGDRG
jgi:pyrimidine operon attenuation protein/uracil phosphoribosyltransferase